MSKAFHFLTFISANGLIKLKPDRTPNLFGKNNKLYIEGSYKFEQNVKHNSLPVEAILKFPLIYGC